MIKICNVFLIYIYIFFLFRRFYIDSPCVMCACLRTVEEERGVASAARFASLCLRLWFAVMRMMMVG